MFFATRIRINVSWSGQMIRIQPDPEILFYFFISHAWMNENLWLLYFSSIILEENRSLNLHLLLSCVFFVCKCLKKYKNRNINFEFKAHCSQVLFTNPHLCETQYLWLQAKVNIEVQWADEQTIAAVERNGGRITTAYYDLNSVVALSAPIKFFKSGIPIPRRLTPPANLLHFYIDPTNRGYLADPELVEQDRKVLAQKYGYELSQDFSSPVFNAHKEIHDLLFSNINPAQRLKLYSLFYCASDQINFFALFHTFFLFFHTFYTRWLTQFII